MLISLHLPKIAGLSFAASLQEHFGHPAYQNDYTDWPINTPKLQRNFHALKHNFLLREKDFEGIECIHGHYLPLKYLSLKKNKNTRFVTWMRHPVQRVVSHYHYWKRSYDPKKSPVFQRRMVEEAWSLERFCLGVEVRNLYNAFLWRFPLTLFDFIGITEFYSEDFRWFCKNILKAYPEQKIENTNKSVEEKYRLDADLLKKIEAFHQKDMLLYKKSLSLRDVRLFG